MQKIIVSISYANAATEEWQPTGECCFVLGSSVAEANTDGSATTACDSSGDSSCDSDDNNNSHSQWLTLPTGEELELRLVFDPENRQPRLFVYQQGHELFLVSASRARRTIAVTQCNSVIQLEVKLDSQTE